MFVSYWAWRPSKENGLVTTVSAPTSFFAISLVVPFTPAALRPYPSASKCSLDHRGYPLLPSLPTSGLGALGDVSTDVNLNVSIGDCKKCASVFGNELNATDAFFNHAVDAVPPP